MVTLSYGFITFISHSNHSVSFFPPHSFFFSLWLAPSPIFSFPFSSDLSVSLNLLFFFYSWFFVGIWGTFWWDRLGLFKVMGEHGCMNYYIWKELFFSYSFSLIKILCDGSYIQLGRISHQIEKKFTPSFKTVDIFVVVVYVF